ncbi:MAG TPA: J domain-containing protein [Candidatus Binatia bacterium]|jgi:hypothetical protein|nr:J domain-containing protein [Candidatus Binatia bacterium]
MTANPIKKWLKKRRLRGCALSLVLSGLALGTGVAALFLIFCFFWLISLVVAPITMGHQPLSIGWPLGITCAFATLLFIDSLFSRRDDLSNVIFWLVRESFGIGPRLLVESGRWVWRAVRYALLDVDSCAKVLAWLASKRTSVSKDELLRMFPDLVWSKLRAQLGLVEGVLFLRADLSRVTLTQPLRLRLYQWVRPERQQPQPEIPREPAEPAPVAEPEKLGPYEILGITVGASLAEIKLAYRARVKECHPDRFVDLDADSRDMAEEWTKALNAAYATVLAEARETKATKRTRV